MVFSVANEELHIQIIWDLLYFLRSNILESSVLIVVDTLGLF